jgi:hypothetical protein
VFSWTWVFPAQEIAIDSKLVEALRSVPALARAYLRIVCNSQGKIALEHFEGIVTPSFWVLTPRSQLGSLRRAMQDAFVPLLDRYPDEELERLERQTCPK